MPASTLTLDEVVYAYQSNFFLIDPSLADSAAKVRCQVVGFDFREDSPVLVEYLDCFGTWARAWVAANQLVKA